MLQIHESTIHRIFAVCVVLVEAMFPCFNVKPDDCNLATTILLLKISQLHKTLILGKLWLEFLWLEWGWCALKYILGPNLTFILQSKIRCD